MVTTATPEIPAASPRPQLAHKAHPCPVLGPSYALALARAGSAAAAACGSCVGVDEWRESEAREGAVRVCA